MQRRPWNDRPIADLGEALLALPTDLLRLEPHPYASLGAPYGSGACPFRLRQGVIRRLLEAQTLLQSQHPNWCLAIFDAWRPLAVQAFMVEHATGQLCRERGIDPAQPSAAREQAVADVDRFWAPPNPDPAAPPPHSTGAAVDLTLARRLDTGAHELLEMGSEIDAIGAVSEPDHFSRRAAACADPQQRQTFLRFHGHRQALREVMVAAGFVQHPNEWWHFSWGDQLWAWRRDAPLAHYGRIDRPVEAD
jgi:D-alanyl-D-alanine dipeptidase